MIPHKTPSILQQLMPSRLWRIKTKAKKLYLTFDDGPIPELTNWVLDVLKDKDAKATFFCVGENVQKHSDILQRILNDGHSIGNHTQHHLNGWQTPLEQYLKDVETCHSVLAKHGVETKLFRPPYGRLSWQQKRKLIDFEIVMWDVLSKDYVQTLDRDVVLNETIKATQSGSIIVFHDNLKAEKNLKYVLPRYLDHFKSIGFQFDSLE